MNATLENPDLAASMPAPGKRKTAKILIVDDEPPVRRFIELTLRAVGYEQIIFGTEISASLYQLGSDEAMSPGPSRATHG